MNMFSAASVVVLMTGAFALAGCAGPKEPVGCTGTCHVEMDTAAFVPEEIRVQKGATVHWMFKGNQTGNVHDVTSEDGSFGSAGAGDLSQGETYQFQFNTAGTFKYRCTVHSADFTTGMTGKVIVVA